LSERIPQQHKDKAQDNLERGKHFLTEEYFPEERRDQFIFRCKKACLLVHVNLLLHILIFVLDFQVIIECQKHDDYQESLRWLLGHLEEYAEHGKKALREGKDSQDQVTTVRWSVVPYLSR
jgi:hypothetical protein